MLKLLDRNFTITKNQYIKRSTGKLHNMHEQIWNFNKQKQTKTKKKTQLGKKVSEMNNSLKG